MKLCICKILTCNLLPAKEEQSWPFSADLFVMLISVVFFAFSIRFPLSTKLLIFKNNYLNLKSFLTYNDSVGQKSLAS